MKLILLIVFSSILASCTTVKRITVHADGSASIEQDFLESKVNPEEKWKSQGFYNTENELRNYESSIINKLNDSLGVILSFNINSFDSLDSYLSGLNPEFLDLQIINDTTYIIHSRIVQPLSNPHKNYSYQIEFTFDQRIRNVSKSNKLVKWMKKENKISLFFKPKRLWRKEKELFFTVSTYKSAR